MPAANEGTLPPMSELEMRVSDDDRAQAVVRLREAYAAGSLTFDEFSNRADAAYAARTRSELDSTTDGLAAVPAVSRRRPRRFVIAIFAGQTLHGTWRAGRRVFAVSLFGGADLDCRDAQLDARGLTILSLALFGGIDLYVPQGIEVDVVGFALFGGTDEHGSEGEIRPGSPLVRVVAFSLFGGIDVFHVPAGAGTRLRELRRAAKLGPG
jgi:hypothetical protein